MSSCQLRFSTLSPKIVQMYGMNLPRKRGKTLWDVFLLGIIVIGGAQMSRNIHRLEVLRVPKHTKHVHCRRIRCYWCKCSYTCSRCDVCVCVCACQWSINPFTNQHTETMLYGMVTESFVDNLCTKCLRAITGLGFVSGRTMLRW